MSHALIRFEGGNEMTLSMDMEDGVKNQNHQFVGPEGVINFNREQAVLLDADGLHDPLASPSNAATSRSCWRGWTVARSIATSPPRPSGRSRS
jgi:hypothetical protein